MPNRVLLGWGSESNETTAELRQLIAGYEDADACMLVTVATVSKLLDEREDLAAEKAARKRAEDELNVLCGELATLCGGPGKPRDGESRAGYWIRRVGEALTKESEARGEAEKNVEHWKIKYRRDVAENPGKELKEKVIQLEQITKVARHFVDSNGDDYTLYTTVLSELRKYFGVNPPASEIKDSTKWSWSNLGPAISELHQLLKSSSGPWKQFGSLHNNNCDVLVTIGASDLYARVARCENPVTATLIVAMRNIIDPLLAERENLLKRANQSDYSIGSPHWPGLSKLIEEAGETLQVVGKILGTGGQAEHWDGTNLRQRLEEETSDLVAATAFVVEKNALDKTVIDTRVTEKLDTFNKWHAAGDPPPPRSPISQSDCNHGVTFDYEAAKGLTSYEVRKRWPRLSGLCPKGCGYNGIYYVSQEHFTCGDW